MKGISHFAAGVAVASCFPAAVAAGANGNPLYFILGGVAGLLPDTLDFKFYRYFHRHDMEVIPDPLRNDPRLIADAVALAVNRAFETGHPVSIKLDTIRLGTDRWQSYCVTFDTTGRRVDVEFGPVVDTGGNEVGRSAAAGARASAGVACGIRLDYTAETRIDILDGPTFRMVRLPDGRVSPQFIAWHREWSHSLVLCLGWGILAAVLFRDVSAGVVTACAAAAHVVADQLGFLGSNLWFPFTRRRSEGLKWMHSGEVTPNLAMVWVSCMVIFWNLRASMPSAPGSMNMIQFAVFGAVIPFAILYLVRRCLRRTSG